MSNSTHLYRQLLDFLRQYSQANDLRHFKALAWMVSALICSEQLSLSAWEPYVPSRAKQAQSVERRWRRFLSNARIRVTALYIPLVLVALSGWKSHRLYLAMDTTVLWERFSIALTGCTRTLVFGCSYCYTLCDNPRYGSTNRWVATTSRPALATGYQLSQDWLALASGGSP